MQEVEGKGVGCKEIAVAAVAAVVEWLSSFFPTPSHLI